MWEDKLGDWALVRQVNSFLLYQPSTYDTNNFDYRFLEKVKFFSVAINLELFFHWLIAYK